MKVTNKSLAAIATVVLVVASIGVVCHTNQTSASNSQSTTTEDIASSTMQPIRLVNSEETVFIEGVTAAEATYLDALFRGYEQAVSEPLNTTGTTLWIYAPLMLVVLNWFDPNFNLIPAFQQASENYSRTGPLSYIINPLNEALTSPEAENIFYYKTDEQLGGYRMSLYYFLAGYVYFNIANQTSLIG